MRFKLKVVKCLSECVKVCIVLYMTEELCDYIESLCNDI